MGGLAKALWTIFIIVVPWVGVLVYLIARGDSMADRSMQAADEADQRTREYIQHAAAAPSIGDELSKLAQLKDSGVISDPEFEAQKAKALV